MSAITDKLAQALRETEQEIRRLHDLYCPRYEGKVGEPDLDIANGARAALAEYDAQRQSAHESVQDHDPEPWRTEHNHVHSKNRAVAVVLGTVFEYNARRIVACVNACAGFDTETLEADPQLFAALFEEVGRARGDDH